MVNIGQTQAESSNPGLGGINPDQLGDQCIQENCVGQSHSLNEHTVPGQAGEPGEGNSAAQSDQPGHENTLNFETSPDQLKHPLYAQE